MQLSFGSWWLAEGSALDDRIADANFEVGESRVLQRFLRPGMTVLDVGAHHGYYTLLFSAMVGQTGKVIAFEPSPRERIRLQRHVLLNKCKNVRVESFALGAASGRAELFIVEGREDWLNSLRPTSTSAEAKRICVNVRSLDEFLSHDPRVAVDFIKLDAEGAELEILKGSELLLQRKPRPLLLAEVQDIRTEPWGYAAKEIIDFMVERKFTWFAVSEEGTLKAVDSGVARFDGNFVVCPDERRPELRSLLGPGGSMIELAV